MLLPLISAKRLFLIFYILINYTFLNAQITNSNTRFYHVNDKNGLQSDYVNTIIQDNRGIMWFGTGNGLFNFDGYKVNPYLFDISDTTSLSGNMVNVLHADNQNNIWIGTNFGLCMYMQDNNKFKRITYIATTSFSSSIVDIKQRADGQIIACAPSAILLYNTKKETLNELALIKNIPGIKENERFRKLFIDQKNRLWVCTQFHFIIFDWSSKNQTIIEHNCGTVRNINQADSKHIWISSTNGLFVLNSESGALKKFNIEVQNHPIGEIWDTKIDNQGNLWIGTNQSGLIRYNLEKQTATVFQYNEFNPHGIGNNNIRTIFADRQGILWVGTQYKGVSYAFIDNIKKFNIINNGFGEKMSLTSNIISAILEDTEGNIWLGTDGLGLNKIEKRTGQISHFRKPADNSPGISTNAVLALFEDEEKNLWIGGYRGCIVKYNLITKKWKQYPYSLITNENPALLDVRKFFEDSKKRFWIATNGYGLYLYNRETDDFTNYNTSNSGLIDNYALSIAEDKNQKLWVGTYYGACIFNPELPKEKTHFLSNPKDTTSISDNWIYCIHKDKKGRIWLGTAFGLNLFNPKSTNFSHYNTSKGIPGKEIYGIVEDIANEELWISTNNGLSKFNPQKNTFINYYQDDGLPSNIFLKSAYYKNKDNVFYFGTSDGLVSFLPFEIKVDTFAPSVIITDIQLFFKSILNKNYYNEELKFNYQQSTITIKYSGLNYIMNKGNTYLYKLDGYDKNWNNVENRGEATFTNLDPGRYKFRVKVINRDGYSNNNEATIHFVILPPWWKTFGFKLTLSLTVIGLLFLILRLRTHRINMQNQYLEQTVLLRTSELKNKNQELIDKANELNKANELLIDRQSKIEIQSNELLEVNQQLNEMNSMKDKFFSIIAHDLKNPFSSILGFTELLKTTHLEISPETRTYYTTIIYESCKKVYELLDNLLLWGRSQMKKIDFEPTIYDISLQVNENITLLKELSENKQINIIYKNNKNIPVFADYNMINTVFRNILTNAIKFTPEKGKIEIIITESEESVNCKIKDSGTGIEPDLLKQLFDIDKTITTSGTSGESGTGLGLIICHDFIIRNNGDIGVESTINQGTTFFFNLPNSN